MPRRLTQVGYARIVTKFLRCDRHLAREFIHNAAFAAFAAFYTAAVMAAWEITAIESII